MLSPKLILAKWASRNVLKFHLLASFIQEKYLFIQLWVGDIAVLSQRNRYENKKQKIVTIYSPVLRLNTEKML